MAKREHAYIGLGANVGEARASLERAVRALAALPGVRLAGVSRLYLSRPVGVLAQPDFLNAAVALEAPPGPDAETGALALLAGLKQLESALGRQQRERWGPREVDLDLLLFGAHALQVERPDGRWLVVPHAEMGARLFVLAPLAELAPDVRPTGWSLTIAEAARQRAEIEGAEAVRPLARWRSAAAGWVEGEV